MTSYETPNKSIVLFCFIYLRGLKNGEKNEKSCLWKQSPLLAPHRKWRFVRLHAVCQMKMGYVKQDTWHVSILFV